MNVILLLLSFSALALSAAVPRFQFAVTRVTPLLHHESGTLTIDDSGIEYQSDNKKTTFRASFIDIKNGDASDPKSIRIEIYDRNKWRLGAGKTLTFHLRSGENGEGLAQFVASHLSRPVIGAYAVSTAKTFCIPAYHRARLGGSNGILTIGSEAIRFSSSKEKDSRTWLYRDIESIGTTGPFQFRVTTSVENFIFDLKERLPDAAYQLAWREVYDPRAGPLRQK